MKKLGAIAGFLAVAMVCWRQWLSAQNPLVQPASAVSAADPAPSSDPMAQVTETSPAVPPSDPTVDDGSPGAPAVSSAVVDSAGASDRIASSTPASQESDGSVNSPQGPLTAETGSTAPVSSTEAIVLEEEVNGQIVYHADPAAMGPDGFSLLLQAALQEADGVAASDLLAMFKSQESAETKMELLCASSLLEADQNTQALLELALGSDQAPELRIAAVAYLADQDPSKLVFYFNDSDPDVSLEAQCAYENLSLPNPGAVPGYKQPPPPQNLATPPDSINYVRSR